MPQDEPTLAQILLKMLAHKPLGNSKAREVLGLSDGDYESLKAELLAEGMIVQGRGRGGSIKLAPSAGSGADEMKDQHNEELLTPKRGRGRPPKAPAAEPNGQEAEETKEAPEPKAKGRKAKAAKPEKDKSLETWIWDAACSIRGAKDAPKYKDYILPLIFTKRLCDVFDDELDRIAAEVGSRAKAFKLVNADKKLVRFYLPLEPKDPDEPVWSVIRTLSDKIGEELTTHLRGIAKANPLLQGIIDRVDFNATTHGQRDLADDRLSNLIEAVSTKRLGLKDVEADIIGKSYEYLIRKFAEGGGQSAGEFYTPGEVAEIMARALECEPGMEVYDPCCGSGGLLVKCESAMEETMRAKGTTKYAPLQLHGQEYVPETWAMANMNMIIHDMQGRIEIGDTFKNPKFKEGGRLQTFDRVVANPMWNQDWYTEADYANDEWDRFPPGAGFPGKASADWGWVQHIHASMKPTGRAAIVLDTPAASRGSGNNGNSKEKLVRQWFLENDLVESVLFLPDNLFYNTPAPGMVLFLRKAKPKARQGKVLLVNASALFERRKPKNYIVDGAVKHISDVIKNWIVEDKLSCIVSLEELRDKADFNISPSTFIQTSASTNYRPIRTLLAELEAIEIEAREADADFKRIMQRLVFPEERQKETEFGVVPESWVVVPLEQVAKIERGKFSHRPRNDPRFYGGKYPFVQTGDVANCDGYVRDHTQTLNEEGLEVSRMFPAGTILITIAANIGFTGILSYPATCPDSLIGLTPNERVTKEYLNYYLSTQQPEMDRLAPRGTQKNINIEFLKPWPVLLPPLEDQKAITTALEALDAKKRITTKKRDELQDLFRTLLHELMTGKVRVSELAIA